MADDSIKHIKWILFYVLTLGSILFTTFSLMKKNLDESVSNSLILTSFILMGIIWVFEIYMNFFAKVNETIMTMESFVTVVGTISYIMGIIIYNQNKGDLDKVLMTTLLLFEIPLIVLAIVESSEIYNSEDSKRWVYIFFGVGMLFILFYAGDQLSSATTGQLYHGQFLDENLEWSGGSLALNLFLMLGIPAILLGGFFYYLRKKRNLSDSDLKSTFSQSFKSLKYYILAFIIIIIALILIIVLVEDESMLKILAGIMAGLGVLDIVLIILKMRKGGSSSSTDFEGGEWVSLIQK